MFDFEPNNFFLNLPYILKGELGTFVALGLIAISVIILNKIFTNKD